jgi:esterase/lipase
MALRSAFDFARFFLDAGWATGEYASKLALDPVLRRVAPRTDKPKAVLTLPGFGGPEISLNPLNAFLGRQGFRAEGWGLGTNRGPRDAASLPEMIERLEPKLQRLADKTGGKVALVGQSLGGIYARELARALPHLADRVITLGSPAYLRRDGIDQLNAMLPVAMRWITGKKPEDHLEDHPQAQIHAAPPVPLVAIFSALDGVASEATTAIPACELTFEGALPRENIEIVGSHIGMAVNPLVLVAVCDRLLADPGRWKAFDPAAYLPGLTKAMAPVFYPKLRHAAWQRFPRKPV